MACFGDNVTNVSLEWFLDQEIFHKNIWDDMAHDFVR